MRLRPHRHPSSGWYASAGDEANKVLGVVTFHGNRLQARCDHSHVHQQLSGGRCKDAAYYLLPLIRAILRDIHDTGLAGVKLAEEYDELVKTFTRWAISS